MAKRPTYKGKVCKTASCGGHRAGAAYARVHGVKWSPYSKSFNEGMSIESGLAMPRPRRRRRR